MFKKILAILTLITLLPMPVSAKSNKDKEINMGEFRVTYYCPCHECSEGYGRKTATGTYAKEGRTIAVDPSVIPYGATVIVDGQRFIAEDCGGGIKGDEIDIFLESHSETEELGVQYLDVKIVLN